MTASAASSRAGSSSAAGTANGIRAAAIFCFARVSRAAIVGSLTRKACATSGVATPQTSRSVERDLRLAAERRMAADEDEPQPVVGERSGRRPRRLVLPVGLDQQRQLRLERPAAPQQVERRPLRDGDSHAAGRSGTPSRGQVRSARS